MRTNSKPIIIQSLIEKNYKNKRISEPNSSAGHYIQVPNMPCKTMLFVPEYKNDKDIVERFHKRYCGR